MSLPPDISADPAPFWAWADSAQDLNAWAPVAADQVWQASSLPFSASDVQRTAQQLHEAASVVFSTGARAAFLLCPEPPSGIVAGVRLNAIALDDGASAQDLREELLFPAELQLLAPEQWELETPAGPALRLRQRAFLEDTRAVSDYLSYTWVFPGAAWLLSTSFPDHRVADVWAPAVDELAASVSLASA